ncbi:MAG: hypothetical protein GY722_15145 [bacterium]|nr:hypothetical protein [bacterium]
MVIDRIDPLPAEHELVSFFQAEPSYLAPTDKYGADRMTFVVKSGPEMIEVAIEPLIGDVGIAWARDDDLLLSLYLTEVRRVSIDRLPSHQELAIGFGDNSYLEDLRLRVRPFASVRWATRLQ